VAGSEIQMNTHNAGQYRKFYDEQVRNFSKAHEDYEKKSAKNDDMQSENSYLLNAPVPKVAKKKAKEPLVK
jgi:hypothetical protein